MLAIGAVNPLDRLYCMCYIVMRYTSGCQTVCVDDYNLEFSECGRSRSYHTIVECTIVRRAISLDITTMMRHGSDFIAQDLTFVSALTDCRMSRFLTTITQNYISLSNYHSNV